MCSLPLHQVGPLIHGAVLLRPNFGFGPRLLDPAIMSFRTKEEYVSTQVEALEAFWV